MTSWKVWKKRVVGGSRGEKGKGEGGRCLVVGWLPSLYLSPLIPLCNEVYEYDNEYEYEYEYL